MEVRRDFVPFPEDAGKTACDVWFHDDVRTPVIVQDAGRTRDDPVPRDLYAGADGWKLVRRHADPDVERSVPG